MPSPEPNYAQRAQNCEQERDMLRQQIEHLSTVDEPVDIQTLNNYRELVNEQAAQLRLYDSQIRAMRTDNIRLKEQSEEWRRRATQAEDKLAETRVAMLRCDTFMRDIRQVVQGRM